MISWAYTCVFSLIFVFTCTVVRAGGVLPCCVRAVVCVFQPTLLRVARCECDLVSRDSVRRSLGRVPRGARGRHCLRGVWFRDPREFNGGFYHERLPINNFALTRVRLV